MLKKWVLFIFLCGLCNVVNAEHLVGGDLTFRCNGNDLYSFQLKVYREASPGFAAHDNPAYLFIYNNDNNQLFTTRFVNHNNNINAVTNNDLGPCLQNPDPPAFDFATYNFSSVTLPQNTSGYRVVYQRCCRSNTVNNIIQNFDGNSQGSSYEVQITPKVMQECNDPGGHPFFEFQEFPPTQLCAGEEVLVDQSVDNGIFPFVDSVKYALCAPFEGGSGTNCVVPTPTAGGTCNSPDGQCSEPCPYTTIDYAPGYTYQTPMGPLSQVDINPNTGELIVNPSSTGVYVVGICATAYKDGQVWTYNRRDFQFKVFDCIADGATPPIANNGQPLDLSSVSEIDTVEIESVYLVCNDLSVTFAQNSTQALSYNWDFGVLGMDGDTSIEANPTFTYPDTGTYVVTFVVNANQPCVDTAYGVVKIFPQFNAKFGAESGCFSIPVVFTDSSISTLAENPIIDWQWDFGDGTTLDGVQHPTHQYTQAGSFNVTLTAISELGCSDTYSLTVVTDPAPLANFENLSTCTDLPHQFNNLSTLNGTDLESYVWDFGDGNGLTFVTTDEQPPLQTYSIPGDYNITLVVNSESGCSDTITQVLTVAETVVADFEFTPTQVCPGQELQFTNTTMQSFDSFQWTIDGSLNNDVAPSFTFTTPGSKDVTLVLVSNVICGDTITKTINVENGPLADFSVDSTCTTIEYTFENLSQDNGFAIDEYIWDFGDGSSATGFSPSNTYTSEGDYDVMLVVSSSSAVCSDTTIKTIGVKEIVSPSFTFAPDTICETITPVAFTNTSSGSSWDSIVWDLDIDSLVFTDNPIHVYEASGNYNVSLFIYDDVCGSTEVTNSVNVLTVPNPNLPDTANICDGINFPLSVANNLGYDIMWSTGEISPTIIIDNSIDTVIVAVNNLGCVTTDTTFITRDCPAYIPNSFTPNGDGVNDEFIPLPLNITSFTLKVYDRWGDLVFETSSFTKPWTGLYDDGSKAPLDTYSYVFEGVGLDEKPLFQSGIVNLLR